MLKYLRRLQKISIGILEISIYKIRHTFYQSRRKELSICVKFWCSFCSKWCIQISITLRLMDNHSKTFLDRWRNKYSLNWLDLTFIHCLTGQSLFIPTPSHNSTFSLFSVNITRKHRIWENLTTHYQLTILVIWFLGRDCIRLTTEPKLE